MASPSRSISRRLRPTSPSPGPGIIASTAPPSSIATESRAGCSPSSATLSTASPNSVDFRNFKDFWLVLGSGEAGKWTAWTMADEGHRTAMVERKWLGGSCPNIACLPSKNVIYSARVASLARLGAELRLERDQLRINMAGFQHRKRKMVEAEHQFHAKRTADAGIELIMGEGRFIAPRTIDVALNDGGTRRIVGARVFLDLGSHSAIPNVPGLTAANPMTHIEALDLD